MILLILVILKMISLMLLHFPLIELSPIDFDNCFFTCYCDLLLVLMKLLIIFGSFFNLNKTGRFTGRFSWAMRRGQFEPLFILHQGLIQCDYNLLCDYNV